MPAFHNMRGILTETAGNSYATPVTYKEADLHDRFENGVLTKTPSMFYEKPWLGGRWRLRDAVDYMLTADFAILNLAAERSSDYLREAYQSAQTQIKLGQSGKPYGYAIPQQQWDYHRHARNADPAEAGRCRDQTSDGTVLQRRHATFPKARS